MYEWGEGGGAVTVIIEAIVLYLLLLYAVKLKTEPTTHAYMGGMCGCSCTVDITAILYKVKRATHASINADEVALASVEWYVCMHART